MSQVYMNCVLARMFAGIWQLLMQIKVSSD
jgi:hypothetical protein